MEKIKELAILLLDYSTRVKKGEKLVLNASVEAKPLINLIIKEATKRGVYVHLILNDDDFSQNLINNQVKNTDKLLQSVEFDTQLFETMDAYIAIRATKNDFSNKNVSLEDMNLFSKLQRKSLNKRIEKKWCILKWPTHAFAQKAEMNYDDYFDFCLNSMVNDYKKMTNDLQPLADLMAKTDKVKIKGPNTNLTFSIKGIGSVICSGLRNIPDGEVYSAPVIDSVNGMLTYNTYSMRNGKKWENISLTFKNGQIIKASCSNASDEELMQVFNVDKGAKYIGEFSLGVNKNITQPIGDILYDEKIGGSFHFTPGQAYAKANNGNVSSLHWDLVCIQNKNYGGGEIYFDDVLIRKDGKFILPELESLN